MCLPRRYTDDEVVSTDFVHSFQSSIVDAKAGIQLSDTFGAAAGHAVLPPAQRLAPPRTDGGVCGRQQSSLCPGTVRPAAAAAAAGAAQLCCAHAWGCRTDPPAVQTTSGVTATGAAERNLHSCAGARSARLTVQHRPASMESKLQRACMRLRGGPPAPPCLAHPFPPCPALPAADLPGGKPPARLALPCRPR